MWHGYVIWTAVGSVIPFRIIILLLFWEYPPPGKAMTLLLFSKEMKCLGLKYFAICLITKSWILFFSSFRIWVFAASHSLLWALWQESLLRLQFAWTVPFMQVQPNIILIFILMIIIIIIIIIMINNNNNILLDKFYFVQTVVSQTPLINFLLRSFSTVC